MESSSSVVLHRARLVDLIAALEQANFAYLQSRVAARLSKGTATLDQLIDAVYKGAKEPECPERNIAVAVCSLRKRGFIVVREHGVYKHLLEVA